jgi:glycosyltransferase involved in cell wall biosynthesis
MSGVTRAEDRLRIGFLQAYPGRLYGSQRIQLNLMEGVRAFGIEPLLLVTAEGPVAEAARSAGISVIVLPPPSPLDRYGRVLISDGVRNQAHIALALAAYTARLTRVLHAERIRVLHANEARAALLAGWAARGLGVPMVWHHLTDEGDELPRRPFALAYRLAERVIAPANSTARSLLEVIGEPAPGKVHVVHDGVRAAAEATGPADPPRVGVLAALAHRKGHHVLVRAFSDVVAAVPEAELVIVGAPSEAEPGYADGLRDTAERLSVASRVRFLGFVDQPSRVYADLRVFCLPSLEDALPLVIMEAMAAGLPVVSTTVGGIPELVEDGRSGMLVPPGDAPALARALTSLLQDPARGRAMGAAGAERVRSTFSLAESNRLMAEHLHAAAGGYRRRRPTRHSAMTWIAADDLACWADRMSCGLGTLCCL